MTRSAKSFVECRVFSSGMLPMCRRQKTCPTCRPLISSSICWRTVSGLPGDHVAVVEEVLPGEGRELGERVFA